MYSREKMADSCSENTKKRSFSCGKQCAAFNCANRSYVKENGKRISTNNILFLFPKDKNERRVWCNLIKRKDGMDGFQVTENSTYVCSIHFKPGSVIRAPGGTRHSLQKGARPYLHQWNNFGQEFKERKPPIQRQSFPY